MDVLHLADKRCSGRRECAIRIPDAELDATKPCFKELKTYLEASYTCVPGNCQHLFVTKKVCATVFSSSSDKYLGTLFLFVYLSELFRKFMPVARVYFSVIFITLYRHGDLFRGEDVGSCTEQYSLYLMKLFYMQPILVQKQRIVCCDLLTPVDVTLTSNVYDK